MYKCLLCDGMTIESVRKYHIHQRFHRHTLGATFKCVYPNCRLVFKTYDRYNRHVIDNHTSNRSVAVHNFNYCNVTGCHYKNRDKKRFCEHIYSHLKAGTKLKCPFIEQCKCISTVFEKVNVLRQHIIRKHYHNTKQMTSKRQKCHYFHKSYQESCLPDEIKSTIENNCVFVSIDDLINAETVLQYQGSGRYFVYAFKSMPFEIFDN